MAIEKVINVQVNTNVENTSSKLNALKSNLKGVGTQAVDATQSVQGMSKMEGTINAIGDGVGKLNPAFGSAVKGANGLILKMWEVVANPIGAILAGIVITAKFLYEAFQSSVAGGKELKTIFAGISAVGEQVKDAIFGLGRALINTATAAYKFITLDFAGAAEDMKKANGEATESYKQLGNAVDGTTFKIIKNLEKQQQANDKARKIQAVVQSETNKLLVQSREILTDETASIKDKKKALEEVTKAETASSKEKTRIAAEDLKILKSKAAAMGGEAEKKMKGEIREATIALNEAETENAMTGIKLNKQKKMLGRQEVSDAKEAADALKTLNDEKIAKAKEAYEADKTALTEKLKEEGLNFQQRRDLIKADLILNAKDRKKLNDEINKEENKTIDDHNKAIADLNKRYDEEKENRLADTAVKKEDLDYKRKVLEIEKLAQTELEKQTLIEKLNAEHRERLAVATKTDEEKIAEELKKVNDKKVADAKEATDKQIAVEKTLTDAKRNALDTGLGLLLQFAGKNKAVALTILAIQKGLAIADIVVGASKAIALASSNLAAVPAFIGVVPNPAYIGQAIATAKGIISTKISAASSIASILASGISTAASITGGGASSGGASGGGGATGATAPTPPSFNVVGASGTNQLAQSIGAQQQQPIQAYVVANNVTTAQSLQRNIIESATIGG
jgi:hypothetical protein